MKDDELKRIKAEAIEAAESMTIEENHEMQLAEFEKARKLTKGFFSAIEAAEGSLICIAMILKMIEKEVSVDWKDLWEEVKASADEQLTFTVTSNG